MTTQNSKDQVGAALQCGIVMPISAIDGCSSEHWSEVKAIIQDAVASLESPRFVARLVSDAEEVGVIQKRIVQGVYSSDVVVCDVSCKNPNVMFELGLRLAFDKPTVIIKDDKTDYTFDTGVIEHITYPRDLRFQRMVEFKQLLAQKVQATYAAAQNDPDHSTFLKNFGTFKVAQLREKEASAEQLILDTLGELQREVAGLRRRFAADTGPVFVAGSPASGDVAVPSPEMLDTLIRQAESLVAMGTQEAINELASFRPIIERLLERSDLTVWYREKVHQLASRVFSAQSAKRARPKVSEAG